MHVSVLGGGGGEGGVWVMHVYWQKNVAFPYFFLKDNSKNLVCQCSTLNVHAGL